MRIKILSIVDVRKIEALAEKLGFEISDNPDIVVTVGGDGSLIYGFKNFRAPLLPVRLAKNHQSLGFIADVPIDDMEAVLKNLARKDFRIEKKMLLELWVDGEKAATSMNEINLHFKDPRRAVRFTIYSGGKKLFTPQLIVGDGVIVATPVGSTAYNEAVGGYLVDPRFEKIIVTLNNALGLRRRPEYSRVLSSNAVVRIMLVRPEKAWVAVDGYELFSVRRGQDLLVRKSSQKLHLVKVLNVVETWRQKLLRRRKWLHQAWTA